ncbi:MAG TPA: hypothetical protein VN605_00485 [Thermoanaerobaculia bacterium]|nr:hypothetical protein [Thermoanaerobaculia bacterium]
MVKKKAIPLKSFELTPEQKAAARAELQKLIDKAAADGVYEKFAALEGKVNWSMTYEELHDKSDDRD